MGQVSVSATVYGSTLTTNVTNLTNGTSYPFTVVAINSVGESPVSTPSNAVTPATASLTASALTRISVSSSGEEADDESYLSSTLTCPNRDPDPNGDASSDRDSLTDSRANDSTDRDSYSDSDGGVDYVSSD